MARLALLLPCLLVVACIKVGPDYAPPTIALADQFAGAQSGSGETSRPETAWWDAFGDPLLSRLLTRAAAQNLDYKAALARIGQARAQLRTTGLNAQTNGDATKTRVRSRVEDFSITNDAPVTYDAAYVVDLFGGFARDRERAKALYQAAQLDTAVARMALLADLTSAYIELRHNQAVARLVEASIASDRATLRLVSERRREGLATQLEEQQAIARLATTEADLPLRRAQVDIQIFRIATLLAEPAQSLAREIRASGTGQPFPDATLSVGVPADLVRNRPDVLSAERNLAAATAAIGVAQAQLYPSLTLSGTLSYESFDQWSFTRGLVVPVLNRGALLGTKDARIARARETELAWRSAVLAAIEEVQIALREARSWQEQSQILHRATQATRRLETLTAERFNLGQVALNDVLDAKKQVAEMQRRQAGARRQYALAWARLQVASGAGWRAVLQAPAETQAPDNQPDPAGLAPVVAAVQRVGHNNGGSR